MRQIQKYFSIYFYFCIHKTCKTLDMQTILNDIELDVAELKYLLQALTTTADPKLAKVAGRNISHLKERLDELQRFLEASASSSQATTGEPAHTEEKAETFVREEVPSSSAKEEPSAPLPTEPEEEAPQPEVSLSPATQETESGPILAERIRPTGDLRHSLSLNDTFRFARALCDGDVARLHDLLTRLDGTHTADEAVSLLHNEVPAQEGNPTLAEFEELLKKHFDR